MSETKFTKGEWSVDCLPCDQTLTVQIKSGDIEIMSVTPWFDENPTLEESIANAHLFSAAPNHDKALCMVEDKIPSTPNIFGGEYSIILNQEEVEQIRKSLSKARGEK